MAAVFGGFLLMGIQGLCHEHIKRPVTRFIDFYVAAEQIDRPLPVWQRIAIGLILAADDSADTQASAPSGKQQSKVTDRWAQ